MKLGKSIHTLIMAVICSIGVSACCTNGPMVATQEVRVPKTALSHFRFDKSEIAKEDKAALDELAVYLKENPDLNAKIEGYADVRGPSDYNIALSKRRAIAIASYLQQKGIEANRIETHSFGAKNLADLGQTNEAHARNRRAEIYVEAPSATV
jgi:peptidoglycan-associated lipoprotein